MQICREIPLFAATICVGSLSCRGAPGPCLLHVGLRGCLRRWLLWVIAGYSLHTQKVTGLSPADESLELGVEKRVRCSLTAPHASYSFLSRVFFFDTICGAKMGFLFLAAAALRLVTIIEPSYIPCDIDFGGRHHQGLLRGLRRVDASTAVVRFPILILIPFEFGSQSRFTIKP